jgi:diaminopimelate decarboxylase
LADEGLGFDASTMGELEWVLSSGVDPSRIEFQGNNKSVAEIHRALEVGVGAVVVDSEWEARRLAEVSAELGRTQRVMIRVNSGIHAGTHEYLATAREDQKFGIARSDLASVVEIIAAAPHLELVGLHSHIGSQIVSPEGFIEAANRLLAEYEKLQGQHPLDTLNLGGGFAIPYTPSDPDSNLEEIASALGATLDEWAERGVAPSVISFEPGRIISGPAGVTLYTVGTTKQVIVGEATETDTRLYVSVDGGMSDNLRTSLYGARYTVRLANRSSDAAPALVRVVGKHCESGDIVVSDDYLPGDVTPGDVLMVAQTGAYCHSLSSNYNAVGRPAVVSLQGGEARVSLKAETIEDVLSRDVGLAMGPGAPGRV